MIRVLVILAVVVMALSSVELVWAQTDTPTPTATNTPTTTPTGTPTATGTPAIQYTVPLSSGNTAAVFRQADHGQIITISLLIVLILMEGTYMAFRIIERFVLR